VKDGISRQGQRRVACATLRSMTAVQPPRTFDEMIAPHPPEVREAALWLRDVILTEFPHLDETIYGASMANALYSVGSKDRVALGIQPGPKAVKLYVHDPQHLETKAFKLEGSGKHMRHVKFTAKRDDLRVELIALIRIPVERRS
jgi:hypothetical protein